MHSDVKICADNLDIIGWFNEQYKKNKETHLRDKGVDGIIGTIDELLADNSRIMEELQRGKTELFAGDITDTTPEEIRPIEDLGDRVTL